MLLMAPAGGQEVGGGALEFRQEGSVNVSRSAQVGGV